MFSPNKSSIKEANDHLQALYERVAELENTVKEQASALMHRDETSQANVKEAVRKKDLEISELHKTLSASESTIQKLLSQNKEKEAQIELQRSKLRLLEDACDNLPSLESCVWTLKQAHDLILSTGSVRSRHASGPRTPTPPTSGRLQNDVNMEVSAAGNGVNSGNLSGRRSQSGSFVNSYNAPGNINRSFSISDVEDDGESTTV